MKHTFRCSKVVLKGAPTFTPYDFHGEYRFTEDSKASYTYTLYFTDESGNTLRRTITTVLGVTNYKNHLVRGMIESNGLKVTHVSSYDTYQIVILERR